MASSLRQKHAAVLPHIQVDGKAEGLNRTGSGNSLQDREPNSEHSLAEPYITKVRQPPQTMSPPDTTCSINEPISIMRGTVASTVVLPFAVPC